MRNRLFANLLGFGLALGASFFIFPLPWQAQDLPAVPLNVHPLPPTLARWQDSDGRGDYFDSLEFGSVGALVWSTFPVTVSIQSDRASWTGLVRQAMAEWSPYLPLQEVSPPELANIVVKREIIPTGASFNPETGKLEIPRVRSAITQYEIFVKENRLEHRMTVRISPHLNEASALSAIRHEFGHALGIWGHSPVETDVMYFSQTRDLPALSIRDVNTLKKVYGQATRLGWEIGQ